MLFGKVHHTLLSLLLLFSLAAPAQEIELYSSRPDILTVEAQRPKDSKQNQLRQAHVALVAELFETYPKDTHLFFLARDAENLFDIAQLATSNSTEAQRIHLLNVSRANMNHELLKEYLAQHGISDESIESGKKILFIDTGFAGTIPKVIGRLFKPENAKKLKTHLIVSSNPEHPSSRLFLSHINPLAHQESPSSMHNSIVEYEHMPRFNHRADHFVKTGEGHIQPASLYIERDVDGKVSKKEALEFMQGLKYYWEKTGKSDFAQYRKVVRYVRNLLVSEAPETISKIKTLVHTDANKTVYESIVRDLIESRENASLPVKYTRMELEMADMDGKDRPKKFILLEQHPEWAQYLEDPVIGIKKLFTTNNWSLISTFFDAQIDSEITKAILTQLFDGPATGIKKNLQVSILENANPQYRQELMSVLRSLKEQRVSVDFKKFIISNLPKDLYTAINDLVTLQEIREKSMHDLVFSKMNIIVARNFLSEARYLSTLSPEMDQLIFEITQKLDASDYDSKLRDMLRNPQVFENSKALKYLFENLHNYFAEKMYPSLAAEKNNYSPKIQTYIESMNVPPYERPTFIQKGLEAMTSKISCGIVFN